MLKTNKEIEEKFDKDFHLNVFGNLSNEQMYFKKELPNLVKHFFISQRKEDIAEIQKMIEDLKQLERWTENACPMVNEKAIEVNKVLLDLSIKLSLLN